MLKLFVATHATQGRRKSDFCHADEGDLVTFAIECDRDRGNPDGSCGCRRSMQSLTRKGATTTFKVAQVDLNKSGLFDALKKYYEAGGWGELISDGDIRQEAEELIDLASSFSEGKVIEKRGNSLRTRQSEEVRTQ